DGRHSLCVQLDGKVIGWAPTEIAKELARYLRVWKTEGLHKVPLDLEIGFVPPSKGGQSPGLFLFGSRSRMMRPVRYIQNGKVDSIGSFEQVYMEIAIKPQEILPG